MNREEFLKRREDILNECTDIQHKKSNDYANDDDVFQAFNLSRIAGISPEQGMFSRVLDKISRLGNIIAGKDMKVGEKSLDTVQDTINYLLMLQIQLELQSNMTIDPFEIKITKRQFKEIKR